MMDIILKAGRMRKNAVRTLVNSIPARMINVGYNTYSSIYKGQLSLGFSGQNFKGLYSENLRRGTLMPTIKNAGRPAYFESEVDEIENNGRGDYETVYYQDFTKEGKKISFRRLVSMEAVSAGDKNPSVLLVPGFANNSDCFNISNQYSIAKDLADKGRWVYLFDPRGMGINKGSMDPYCSVDTLIDHDLPTVLGFISRKSNDKPSILMGHSMGGLVAENMVLNWGLRLGFDKIKLDENQKKSLDSILVSKKTAEKSLQKVKAVISLGSPKCFDKQSHVFFPSALWLNHITRILRLSRVPVRELSVFFTQMPILKNAIRFVCNSNIGDLNFLMCPENHKKDKFFIERYFKRAAESVPLGIGFQMLKAVYEGQGFKRMDQSALDYTNHFAFFPEDIPVFHIWGERDSLVPLKGIRYSRSFPHKIKNQYYLQEREDVEKLNIPPERGQAADFIIKGANHLDLLYGKKADDIVTPLVDKIINTIWPEQASH